MEMVNKMKLDAETAKAWLYGDEEGVAEVYREDLGSGRWSNHYDVVFSKDGEFWKASYEEGTGDEGERPWEHEDEVEFVQVYPHQVMTTVYKVKPQVTQ